MSPKLHPEIESCRILFFTASGELIDLNLIDSMGNPEYDPNYPGPLDQINDDLTYTKLKVRVRFRSNPDQTIFAYIFSDCGELLEDDCYPINVPIELPDPGDNPCQVELEEEAGILADDDLVS